MSDREIRRGVRALLATGNVWALPPEQAQALADLLAAAGIVGDSEGIVPPGHTTKPGYKWVNLGITTPGPWAFHYDVEDGPDLRGPWARDCEYLRDWYGEDYAGVAFATDCHVDHHFNDMLGDVYDVWFMIPANVEVTWTGDEP
jgi:hypothetical protein